MDAIHRRIARGTIRQRIAFTYNRWYAAEATGGPVAFVPYNAAVDSVEWNAYATAAREDSDRVLSYGSWGGVFIPARFLHE